MSRGDRKFAPLFSVWEIDAWADGNDGWDWNNQYKLFEFRTDALNLKRAFLSRLRKFLADYVNPITTLHEPHALGRGWYYVTDDWDIMELCRKCDGQPWYACIRETPSP